MKKLFLIEIGEDEQTGMFLANVISVTENKGQSIESASLRLVMSEVSKSVRKKTNELRKFPLPEPSRIIGIENGTPSIIMPSRN